MFEIARGPAGMRQELFRETAMQTMIFDPNPPPFSTIIASLSELEKRINAWQVDG